MARGSIDKRNNGYVYRIDLGVDPTTGKRRQISRQGFKNKKSVERALAEHLEQIRSGTHVDQSKMTTAEYLEQWLDNQKLRLKPTTWASYKTAADRVIARLGARAIQDLTPIEIEGFYSGLAVKGTRSDRPLKAKTIRNTHTIFRKALSDAERLGIVNRNAAAAARPPIAEQVEQATWSSEELRTFFAFTADDELFAAYVLLATTGMRRGEALGLRWRDLDLDGAQLAVQQTLTTIESRMIVSTPKTAKSRRTIYLDPDTISILRAHRKRQIEARLAAGSLWVDESDNVFVDPIGRPINPDWFTREFNRRVRDSGLQRIRLHDLRHTFATLALKNGMHPKVVSDRLGHASVGITLDLYSHVTPAIGRDAAGVVASQIFGD